MMMMIIIIIIIIVIIEKQQKKKKYRVVKEKDADGTNYIANHSFSGINLKIECVLISTEWTLFRFIRYFLSLLK